jgi:hypothetical protein
LTDPTSPTHCATCTYDTPGTASAVVLDSTATYAYVADGSSLQIIDLSNSSAPTLAGSLALGGSQVGIAVSGTMTYLADQTGILVAVDVTNPHAPVSRGAVLLTGAGSLVAVDGTRAAVLTTSSSDNLDIVDVTNPLSLKRLGTVTLGPTGTAKGVALANNIAYVAGNTKQLMLYDISTPATPVLRGNGYTVGSAFDVRVLGNRAYVADQPATIDIIGLP